MAPGAETTADAIALAGDVGLVVLDERGRRFVPLRPRLVLGRDPDCDVVLTDPLISRRHAYVLGTDPPTVVDAGSKLGTRVGGRTLGPGERLALTDGVALWLGTTCVTVGRLTATSPTTSLDPGQVVASPRMVALLELATLAAQSPLAILVHGETGSGKELIAEHVHRASGRPGPLVRINCAAVAESMPEAELFGHERGAFTGAVAARPGLFEAAHRGTLFLDEVADMSAVLQAKVLRVIERGEVLRVGAVQARQVDVRIVAASHRSLPAEVQAGRFREDLLYRLAGIQLEVPPLRERPEDVLPLARRFLAELGERGAAIPTLTPEAEAWLLAQRWPGNVRELRATMLRAAVLRRSSAVLTPAHFLAGAAVAPPVGPPGVAGASSAAAPTAGSEATTDERARIAAALAEAGHNQTRAAELLGLSRRTLVRRLSELGFPRPRKGSAT